MRAERRLFLAVEGLKNNLVKPERILGDRKKYIDFSLKTIMDYSAYILQKGKETNGE